MTEAADSGEAIVIFSLVIKEGGFVSGIRGNTHIVKANRFPNLQERVNALMAVDPAQGALAPNLDGSAMGTINFLDDAFVVDAAAEGGVTHLAMGLFNGTLEKGDAANGLQIAMSFTDAMELWGNGIEHIAGLVVENVHVNLRGPMEYEALGSNFWRSRSQLLAVRPLPSRMTRELQQRWRGSS
jgi:hypothetical protein